MAINLISRTARRKKRVSANISGSSERPRVSIYRSHKYIYAQAINDDAHNTVASVSSVDLKKEAKGTKSEKAKQVGIALAEKLKGLKISAVVFDRSAYAYNGRVKALAEGLREGGIQV